MQKLLWAISMSAVLTLAACGDSNRDAAQSPPAGAAPGTTQPPAANGPAPDASQPQGTGTMTPAPGTTEGSKS